MIIAPLVLFVLVSVVLLSYLFSFLMFKDMGRGDWYMDIVNGYRLDRINRHQITLVLEQPDTASNSIVVDNFFVSYIGFNERYIGLIGIPTESRSASDEEIEHAQNKEYANYYLIDTQSSKVMGPFESESEYLKQCDSCKTGTMGEWFSTYELENYSG